MAESTQVNPQITDAATQANVKVLGDASAVAMGNLYQAAAQALSLSLQNAVAAQQQANIIAQAATTQGVALLYSVDTGAPDTVMLEDLLGRPEDDEDDD